MDNLDLKYRPQLFSEVIGNTGVKNLLLAKSKIGQLTKQSLLFSGPKGCGKTTLARIVARAITCENVENGEPCNICSSCISILNEQSEQVQELDAASQGTIEKIRSMVKDVDYEIMEGMGHRIYILDEAQRLSKAAQDALLKSIENRLLLVIMCTTEPHKIQGPIRDRLEEYPIRVPKPDELQNRLRYIIEQEKIEIEEPCIEVIMQVNEFTPRSSILSLNMLSSLGPITNDTIRSYFRFESYELINGILSTIDSNPPQALVLFDKLSDLESPTWICDSFVAAISSAFRESIGIKKNYPISTNFFNIRQRGWVEMAKQLALIERPSYADIEVVLLSNVSNVQIVPNIQPIILMHEEPKKEEPKELPKKEEPKELPKKEEPKELSKKEEPKESPKKEEPKTIEIDGIKFSANESLTSLDEKVNQECHKETETNTNLLQVKLDQNRVPITPKEFNKSFLRKFRSD